MQLVLASTSRYRRALLERLGMPFAVADSGIPEEPHSGETPEHTARRLAETKARAVAHRFREALIVGCDQVAVFHTAVCVYNTASGVARTRLVACRVAFRTLDDQAIERYLAREQPYDCAGSAKSEGLGIALIAKMEGEDPNALVGLPLIALVDLLREQGMDVL